MKPVYYILLILTMVSLSCSKQNTSEKNEIVDDSLLVSETSKKPKTEEDQPSISKKENEGSDSTYIEVDAIVISVEEELVMPADYLTTVMKVKTANGDTLTFTDADGFEGLTGQEIPLKYRLISQSKWLVCMDCTSFEEKANVVDITSVASEVRFKQLKLSQFIEDPYIETASTFVMVDEQGQTEEFLSVKHDLVRDSTKMSQSFHNYGFIITFYPELENRIELESLSE
ncbi:hypothetical protein JMN32_10180 [Fulvivirga sp. 29W222]|uniref:Lipoprotein n=1 Tax=Fulvivirga marina TaxID=2494733 RepID=A0A937FV25_9BACT|nr:hypothetical protein [Fulvivirga marina]MBL6446680.1 hypothetical protein [Fulvivirga marina]